MKRGTRVGRRLMAAVLFGIATIAAVRVGWAADPNRLRPAGAAGSFYPADPKALTAMMDSLLAQAEPPVIHGSIMAVIAPHAGYPYSGPVAAYTYAALQGRHYARVVVIAPSHFEAFDFTSVYDGDGYVTPLGAVRVDKAFAQKVVSLDRSIRLSGRGHLPTRQGTEHALEVQLPWLQHVLGDFALVPIIMGDQSYESSRALGVALAKLIHDGDTLIVASSDLSHYHPYNDAVKLDHKTLHALEEWDYFSMSQNFQAGVWEACGGAPIVAAMIAAERMGANEARLLHYANSGDTSGDRSRVVGYGAAALVKTADRHQTEQPFSLSSAEKKQLLSIARTSVEYAVRQREPWPPPAVTGDALNQERGAFVTIRESGELRGCVGYTSAANPLYITVRDTATLAALRDTRFQPISASELPRLDYEVSVLSPLRRVTDLRQIRIGEHGLLMKDGRFQGLLLPQVPVEARWDRTRFLEETCMKAGMRPKCWTDEQTDIFLFTAVVFSENRPSVTPQSLYPGLPMRPATPAPASLPQ